MARNRNNDSSSRRFFAGVGKGILTILLIGVLAGVIFSCVFFAYLKDYLMPQVSFSLDSFKLNQNSVIYYQDKETGQYSPLQSMYGNENRIWASYKDIPVNLIYATVAIEDKRFYEHNGVDWLRTAKASANLFMGGSSTYGASTITQQLVKNLTNDADVTVRRKLVEIFRALEMEKQYTKEEIMEWYLNTIYLGEQAYGVRTASYAYFAKDVSELDLAQCASLIAVTNNPSIYDPYISDYTKDKNKERQMYILQAMLDQGYITQEEYNQSASEELNFQYAESDVDSVSESGHYSYFVDQVVRDVIDDLVSATGYDEAVISSMITNGGYQIYSTIDIDAQQAAEDIYENMENIPETETSYQQLQSAIVIIDNSTGDISAIVGGVGEKEGSLTLSRATQSLLAPGSTMKPVAVYGPALNLGLITPATVVDDTPFTFGAAPWPSNESNTYAGLTNILSAMKTSTNTIAVKVLDGLSVDYAYNYAVNEMGLDSLVDEYELNGVSYTDKSYWSLALGGTVQGVTIRDLTAAYAAIENGGVYREARTYTKVLDSEGNVVLDNSQSSHVSLSEKAAYYLTYMMEETVKDGTGFEAKLDNMPVAGKTGTTSDDMDRWFAGYTPYHTAVVWCGYDMPQEIILKDSNIDNPASVLWNKVMSGISASLPTREFDRPSDVIEVEVCADSGLLPTEWCEKDIRGNRTTRILLATEDVPTNYCNLHVEESVCISTEGKHVANEYCSTKGGTIVKYGMLNYTRQFPLAGIAVQDQQYCIGYSVLKSGYSEARTSTMNPVNEVCSVHSAVRSTVPLSEDEVEAIKNQKENEASSDPEDEEENRNASGLPVQ